MADGDLPSDGGQDICTFLGSFINQRHRVEQLLNWLRESQTACTDTNCFDDINGLPGSELGPSSLADDQGGNNYECDYDLESGPFGIVLCVVFALLTMYALSLNNNRGRTGQHSTLPQKDGVRLGDTGDDRDQFRRRRDRGDDPGGPAL